MNRILRIKSNENLRNLANTNSLGYKKMIQPLFVVEGITEKEPIKGLSNVFRETESSVIKQIEADCNAGVSHFLLFLVPATKSDTEFSSKFYERVIKNIKHIFPNITLWLDTCICSITTTGHCCIFKPDGIIDTNASVKRLSELAVLYANSGADGIAPSDMMDGRVLSHRTILNENGFENIPIMSYSTKFKSNFYGPFRGAADSKPMFGDRSSYQLDVSDRLTAIQSSVRDANEGADFLMVKPGISSIDLITPIKEKTNLPIGAYQVSGEYASLVYLDLEGFVNFEDALVETWNVFRRTGVNFLITYGARLAKRIYE
ncbi:porphobilinogen synthase [Leptospira sp. 96542]|nr:porphobilinogen synthase [Leptospira sp. 96542]